MATIQIVVSDEEKEYLETEAGEGTTLSNYFRLLAGLSPHRKGRPKKDDVRRAEGDSASREVALAQTIGQGAAIVEAKLSTPAEGTQSRTREHATDGASNANGYRELTVEPIYD